MIRKGTKLYSIVKGYCPKCHEESMYCNKNPYVLYDVFKMRERCSNCDTKYRIEPSFFYGSMYVSYGLGIAVAIATFTITRKIHDTSITKANYLLHKEMLNIFIRQNWANNSSSKNLCASLIYWCFVFSLRNTMSFSG